MTNLNGLEKLRHPNTESDHVLLRTPVIEKSTIKEWRESL